MQYTNLHTHTVFSDGTCTPEEMAQAAIEKNMLSLGFSDHSPMDHDLTYCVKHQALPAYCREIRRLKEKYKDQIEIALGLEMDSLTSSCVCRAAENLIFAFDEARQLLIAHGFDSMIVWKNGALQEVGIC